MSFVAAAAAVPAALSVLDYVKDVILILTSDDPEATQAERLEVAKGNLDSALVELDRNLTQLRAKVDAKKQTN